MRGGLIVDAIFAGAAAAPELEVVSVNVLDGPLEVAVAEPLPLVRVEALVVM